MTPRLRVLALLADGSERTCYAIVEATGLSYTETLPALHACRDAGELGCRTSCAMWWSITEVGRAAVAGGRGEVVHA